MSDQTGEPTSGSVGVAPDDDPASVPGPEHDSDIRGWGWHLMQLSSWLLLVMLPVHVLSTWVFHDPGHFGVALYVDRWHNGGWRFFDGALVVLALLHGGIGLNGMLRRAGRTPAARTAIAVGVGVVVGVVGLLAVSTVLSFNLS